MNDIRWTQGGRRGGGAQVQKQCTGLSVQALYRSSGLHMSAGSKLLVLTGKKLTFKLSLYIFEYRPSPLHPLCVHSRDDCSQTFPVLFFFVAFTCLCIIVNPPPPPNTHTHASLPPPSPPSPPPPPPPQTHRDEDAELPSEDQGADASFKGTEDSSESASSSEDSDESFDSD